MSETKITVLLDETLRREAKAAAALRGETLSDMVRAALEKYVVETKRWDFDPDNDKQGLSRAN